MTVKELIEELKTYPASSNVCISEDWQIGIGGNVKDKVNISCDEENVILYTDGPVRKISYELPLSREEAEMLKYFETL